MSEVTKLDILAIFSHPDDAELTMAGTLLKLKSLGYRTGIADMTRGEMGTRGTPEIRAKEALDAALLAAKELVGTTNTANTIAAAKSEESTAKQIDAIAAQIRTGGEATDARIADLKERIDRGEGGTAGARDQRTEHRLDSSAIVALVAVILVAIGIAVSVGLAVAIH